MKILQKSFSASLLMLTFCAVSAEPAKNKMQLYEGSYKTFALDNPDIGRSCSAILLNGAVYDKFSYLSSRNRISQYINWACGSNFQSSDEMQKSSVSLGIPLENLPEPLKFDFSSDANSFKSSLQKWCNSAYSYLSDDSTRQAFTQTINQGMIGAVGKCIDAQKEIALKQVGAYVYAIPQNQYLNAYGLTLTMRQTIVGQKNQILSIEPKEVRCEIAGKEVRPTPDKPYIITTNDVVFTCYKDGATPSQLAINTYPSAATPWVMLPGTKDDSDILEIKQNQEAILQALQNSNGRNNKRWENLKTNNPTNTVISGNGGSGMTNCPDGYYVSAVQVVDTDGGKFCADCVSVIQAICRPLNITN
jgi:hypothetical protein